jgi:hypothetical protein
MRKIFLFIAVALLLLSSTGYSQTISCSVMPSKIEISFYKSNSVDVKFYFWNSGTTDAKYVIEPDDCLKDILFDYESEFMVKKGTSIENPVEKHFKFKADFSGNKTCSMAVWCSPNTEQSSAITIKRGVASKITIYQPKKEIAVQISSNPSSTSGSSQTSQTPLNQTLSQSNETNNTIVENTINKTNSQSETKNTKEIKGKSFTGMFVFPSSLIILAVLIAIGLIAWKMGLVNKLLSMTVFSLFLASPVLAQEVVVRVTTNVVTPTPLQMMMPVLIFVAIASALISMARFFLASPVDVKSLVLIFISSILTTILLSVFIPSLLAIR